MRPHPRFSVGAELIGKYSVLSELGSGGMGAVVKARRFADGLEVAIKYCFVKGDPARRRFAREVRLMKRIKHPHVMRVLATNLKHSPPYFVMPLATCSLAAALLGSRDEDLVISKFIELCEGVSAVHDAGAVHRDIKPTNGLILDNRVVVSDLGLAKLSARDTTILTETRAVVGTDIYLAPEQRLPKGSRDADRRTDVFQLGKTLYELLTGDHPLLVDFSKVSPGIAHIIRRAIKEHPDDRYQTVGALLDALRVYQNTKHPASNPLAAFESVLSRIDERLKRGEYRTSDIRELLGILVHPELENQKDQFLDVFDKVPNKVLRVAAETTPEALLPVLRVYAAAIDDHVGGMTFSYAETVAENAEAIVGAPGASPEAKALALEALLIAAVRLNRFAAIDTFDALLSSIKADAEAFEVRDMLERNQTCYRSISKKVAGVRLHPAIRQLRDKLADDA